MRQSPLAEKIYCAPGNPGMKGVESIPLGTLEEMADFAVKNNVGLTMVGPEATLCEGIVDIFRAKGLRIVGPDKQAAQLEGSKSFAKDFLEMGRRKSAVPSTIVAMTSIRRCSRR